MIVASAVSFFFAWKQDIESRASGDFPGFFAHLKKGLKPLQAEYVKQLLKGEDVFAIMETGGGKSIFETLFAGIRDLEGIEKQNRASARFCTCL